MYNKPTSEASLLNKSFRLGAALCVTKLVSNIVMNSSTLVLLKSILNVNKPTWGPYHTNFTAINYRYFIVLLSLWVMKQNYVGNYCGMVVNSGELGFTHKVNPTLNLNLWINNYRLLYWRVGGGGRG